MIGDIDWLGRIVGGVKNGEISANAKVAKALIRAGLGVVIIEPGGKKAVCTLNAADKKKADRAAQDKAYEEGRPNYEHIKHPCGIKHVITDEKMLTRARIKKYLSEGANLAIAPGTGERRVLIVDVDTAEERRAFLEDWTEGHNHTDELCVECPVNALFPMTVSSPGVMDTSVNGQPVWTHKNGGHYYFDVPDDVELPADKGKMTWCRCHGTSQPKGTCRNAWTAYYGSGYVLVPPSVRKEGPYRLTGEVQRASAWLTDLIRDSRTPDRAADGREGLSALNADDDPIDVWSVDHSWHEILTADGYTPYDRDSCGCPTYTRPGSPVHAKSATAHEVGCTQYDTSKGHAPVHFWSDALGAGSMSKLSYMARFHYENDMGATMRDLGIATLTSEPELLSLGEIPKEDAPDHGAEVESDDRFAPIDWDELFKEDESDAVFLPGMLLERGQQISLIGDGKSGKSLLQAEWCVRAIKGEAFLNEDEGEPLKILYVDGENSRRDIRSRMESLGVGPDVLRDNFIYLSFPPFKPLDSADGAKQVLLLVQRYRPDVVILDTVSRFVGGKENDSDTWLSLYRLLHRTLKGWNVAGIRLDHFGKDAEKGGRGSSAKSQDIDHVWELSVTEEEETRTGQGIEVTTFLELKRTHTRTGLGPHYYRIKRRGVKSFDEKKWLPEETSHVLADAFDGGGTVIAQIVERPIQMMNQISRILSEEPSGMPLRKIREAIRGDNRVIPVAIQKLEEEGFISVLKQGRAHMHVLLKPFEEETV